MEITGEIGTALRGLRSESLLLGRAMTIAMEKCHRDVGIQTFDALVSTLKTYDTTDVEWLLTFMIDHPELRDLWAATIHRLNADDFHLFLDRLDDLWERMTSLPGVTADTTWAVLSGYHGKDPGTKRSHGTSTFMINAALLTSMQSINFPPAESGVTVYTRYSASVGESLHELAPRMIDFAIDRAADVDRIVEVILTENLWHPEALQYRLDGKLTPTNAAEELAYPMIAKVCDAVPKKLENYTWNHVKTKNLTVTDVLAINTSHTNSHLLSLANKVQNNDLAALQAHATLITDFSSANVDFDANTLDLIFSDLRTRGEDISIVDKGMMVRVGNMISTISVNSINRRSVLPNKSKHYPEYCEALRTVAAIAPERARKYIESDPLRTITLAVRHEATTYESLKSVIEDAASHGALTEGFI